VLGPSVAGFIGSLPIALVALAILLSPRALRPNEVTSRSSVENPSYQGWEEHMES
jgi:hypothetical protein